MSNDAPKSEAAACGDMTRMLERAQKGDPKAAEELLPLVYDELRKLAAAKMARERPDQTLQPTALVHEAWLHLGGDQQPAWQNRAHFFGAAAEAMRRVLVDRVRRKQALKRGGNLERVDIEGLELPSPMPDDELQEEAAKELGVSLATAERVWGFARAWLLREMRNQKNGA